jgi:flagellar biosynthesis/type III secretory pathway protein FliH
MAEALQTGLVVIHQLAETNETLWLRILGKGSVQSRAIDELEALPPNHPFKARTLELLYNLSRNLEVNNSEIEEDRTLIMRLAPLYQQDRQLAMEQGIEQGIEQGRQVEGVSLILRQLTRRMGAIPVNLVEQIRQLPIETLENLGEALLDFENEADLVHWLEQDR